MSVPPLSVAMAVHNGMPFVEQSIGSILDQSFGSFEFVIGDDGSTDGTGDVLRRFAAADRRIRLLRRERKSGLAASANWVVAAARAPLVAIAHADDRSSYRRLERQIALFRAEPNVALVATLSDGIDETGRTVRPPDWWRLIRQTPFAPFPHSAIMFRRQCFDEAGGYRAEAEYWEDFDLYVRLCMTGRLLVVPDVLTSVRHSAISTRLRDEQRRVDEAVDLAYRAIAALQRGADYEAVLRRGDNGEGNRRIQPRTYVARSGTALWSGQRPGVLRRMLRNARLRPDQASLSALLWVGWATLSPRSLRAFARLLLGLRNKAARRRLAGRGFVEWAPLREHSHPPVQAQPTARARSRQSESV